MPTRRDIVYPREKAPTRDEFVRAQENLIRVVDKIYDLPWNRGNFLEASMALTSGVSNLVEHGLGRTVRGWIVLDVDTPALIWRDTTTTADSTKFLALGTTVTCNVRLWVF